MQENSEFTSIPDFPNYGITPNGQVRNLKTGRLMKLTLTREGSQVVNLSNENGQKTKVVRTLVRQIFGETH